MPSPALDCVFSYDPPDIILLYSDTGGGKTAQIGEAADHIDATRGERTVLYSGDRGGTATVRPHIKLGIIEHRSLLVGDPWVAINAAVLGKQQQADGKWVPGNNKGVGLFAFESLSSLADNIMIDMAAKNAAGRGIGGKASFVIQNPDGSKFAGNTQTDYSGVQTFLTEKVWQSQALGVPIIWTSHVKRGSDEESAQTILGPTVAGKALTTVVPRWFTYTFRLDALPAPTGRPRHLLYMEEHSDMGVKGCGNSRIPLGGQVPNFKSVIEPASIVAAMRQIREAEATVEAAMRARRKQ